MEKKNWTQFKVYYDYFVKNKLLNVCFVVFCMMIFVIVYNFFCYTTGLEMQIKVDTVKKVFAFEVMSAFIFTYLGHFTILAFMHKNYKTISVMSVFLTIIAMALVKFTGNTCTSIIMISCYFLYGFIKDSHISSIFRTLKYLVIVSLIQTVFYYFKYYIVCLDFSLIDSKSVRFLLSLDYYIFIGIIIAIKNKIRS